MNNEIETELNHAFAALATIKCFRDDPEAVWKWAGRAMDHVLKLYEINATQSKD